MPIKFNEMDTSNLSINNGQTLSMTRHMGSIADSKTVYTEVDFDTIVAEIELSIKRISELGIDTKKYKDFLTDIKNEVTKSISTSGVQTLVYDNKKVSYGPSIAKLQVLKEQLDVYEVYVRIYNNCLYIENEIETDITNNQLLDMVSQMIANLIEIGKSSNIQFDGKKELISKIYYIVYKVIKIEILKTGESQLCLFVRESDNNAKQLNLIIARELADIKVDYLLEKKLYEIKQNGVNCNYIDIDLIRLIMYQSGEYNFSEAVARELEGRINTLRERIDKTNDLLSHTTADYNWFNRHQQSVSESKKGIKKTLISFGIALAIFFTGGYFGSRLHKKSWSVPYFERTSKIYSSITEDTDVVTDSVFGGYEDGDKEALIRVYDKYDGTGERKYLEFDVSDKVYDTPKEYYDQGFEFDMFPTDIGTDTKPNKYEDSYTEAIIRTYKYLGDKVDRPGSYKFTLVLLYLLLINILLLIDLKIAEANNDNIIIVKLFHLGEVIKDLNTRKELAKSRVANLEKEVAELHAMIVQNDSLVTKFNELYEKNLFLLDGDAEENLRKAITKIMYEMKQIFDKSKEVCDIKKRVKEKE